MALNLRRLRDGAFRVTGDAPVEHSFSSHFLARHLASGLAKVTVELRTEDGADDVVYEMTGFEPVIDGEGNPVLETDADGSTSPRLNFTGWVCRLAGTETTKTKGRRSVRD